MNCPNCDKELKVVREEESNNPKDGTVYDRTLYSCEHCGTWVSVEIPKK